MHAFTAWRERPEHYYYLQSALMDALGNEGQKEENLRLALEVTPADDESYLTKVQDYGFALLDAGKPRAAWSFLLSVYRTAPQAYLEELEDMMALVGRRLPPNTEAETQPRFYREEQRELAQVILQGKLSNLQRKTSEPIAYLANRERKPVQHFVGAGAWDDESVMAELRRHVAETRADPNAVLVVDGSGFAKKGNASCGVARQWCGRLGKVENCQVGVFLAYVTAEGYAPLDRRLYLPDTWAEDSGRREETHVPKR